ncbi:hypothetical protein D6817_02065 [Candidatus Pacearchaeota archaeon]|nr:MAG: hypothetical protein D6817_02065 [Candidatus Pacearchaeota archaeon]
MIANSLHVVDRSVIEQNEQVARKAYEQGDYVLCFLLVHSLVESLLRAFLTKTGKESFNVLILAYDAFLKAQGQTASTFVRELTDFNRRRNRVIHELWKRGYAATNQKLEAACSRAFMMLGLFIEWLETFDPEITEMGFDYE